MFNDKILKEVFSEIFGDDIFFTKCDCEKCDENNECECNVNNDYDESDEYDDTESDKQFNMLDLLKEISDYLNEYIIEEEKEKEKEEVKTPKRPSETIDTQIGLQIHKLTDRYCNEYIRDRFDRKMSNDIYAGLYEFACWIYQQDKID